jgi:hypothetical protein
MNYDVLLSCAQVVMNGNQVPKSVEITQEAIDTGAEVRHRQQQQQQRGRKRSSQL